MSFFEKKLSESDLKRIEDVVAKHAIKTAEIIDRRMSREKVVNKGKQKHICLSCDLTGLIQTKMQIVKCPKCGGLFVDAFYSELYREEFGAPHSCKVLNPLFLQEFLRDLERHRKNGDITTNQYREAVDILTTVNVNEPLLQITLDSYESVPKVTYKGKEVKNKTNVKFEWETNDEHVKRPNFSVKYLGGSEKGVALKTISYENPYGSEEPSNEQKVITSGKVLILNPKQLMNDEMKDKVISKVKESLKTGIVVLDGMDYEIVDGLVIGVDVATGNDSSVVETRADGEVVEVRYV